MRFYPVNPYGFTAGNSILHGIDVRFKLIFVFLLSASLIGADVFSAVVLGTVLVTIAIHSGFPLIQSWLIVPGLPLVIPAIIIIRGLTGTTDIYLIGLPISWQGLEDGGLICLKLLEIITIGGLLTFSTKISEIKAGMAWVLKPLPFLPAQHIAVMAGLMVRFIPVMIDHAEEISQAQQSRGISSRKNPLTRIHLFAGSFMRRMIIEAEDLTSAMAARAYSEQRTYPEFHTTPVSWKALIVVLCLSLILLAL